MMIALASVAVIHPVHSVIKFWSKAPNFLDRYSYPAVDRPNMSGIETGCTF
jgi:hypothetical protein